MSQFLETIKLNNGVFERLSLHQSRIESAMNDFYPEVKPVNLKESLENLIYPKNGLYKCRIIVDKEIKFIEFLPYNPPIIKSLKIIKTEIPSVQYKMADRSNYQFEFAKRNECDDVLLVKNGFLTDTSYCNIALYDGNKWFTPRYPLIAGVNRAQLLNEEQIFLKDIKLDELLNFQYINLFNALNEFGSIQLEVSSIVR